MNKDPLLILLHGWGSTANIWRPVVQQLNDHYECYLPNLPGHGKSQLSQTRLETLAKELLTHIDHPAIWLGWSLGALIAMQAALIAPQQVQCLLIVSGTPAFVQCDGWNTAMSIEVFEQFRTAFIRNADKTLRRFIALQSHGDSQSRQIIQQLAKVAANHSDAMTWGLETLQHENLLSDLSSIKCPVKCLYGKNDALVPVSLQDEMRTRLNASVTVWPDTGHAPFLSRPNEFVSWIKEVTHG